MRKSAEADLGEDALAGQELGAQANHDAQHGQTTIPGLSEIDEAEACVVRHGVNQLDVSQCNKDWSFVACAKGYSIGH